MSTQGSRLEELFEPISIRGRYAYALLCFESILKSMDLTLCDQSWLEFLWKFTSTRNFYDWWWTMVHRVPDVREEWSKLFARALSDFEYDILDRGAEYLTRISDRELAEPFRWNDPDRDSILWVIATISLVVECDAQLPRFSRLKFSKFQAGSESDLGWGIPFERDRLFGDRLDA